MAEPEVFPNKVEAMIYATERHVEFLGYCKQLNETKDEHQRADIKAEFILWLNTNPKFLAVYQACAAKRGDIVLTKVCRVLADDLGPEALMIYQAMLTEAEGAS